MRSPEAHLAQAFVRRCGDDPHKIVALARAHGLDGRLARRAARGIPVNADAYLNLCRACGVNPVLPFDVEPEPLPDLDWARLSVKISATAIACGGLRKLARAWRVAPAMLSRIQNEHPVSTQNFMKVCRLLRCHPHLFLRRVPVSRETITETVRAQA